jgi:hypothetical protein
MLPVLLVFILLYLQHVSSFFNLHWFSGILHLDDRHVSILVYQERQVLSGSDFFKLHP